MSLSFVRTRLALANRLADRRRHLRFESLEVRELLATFAVSNTDDAGADSLRAAIDNANNTAGPDTITFNIPGTGPHTISPLTPLPTITESVTIDGTTEPDYVDAPVVEILGDQQTGGGNGININAPDSTVRGLAIAGFSGTGIGDGSGGGTLIERNYVGVRAEGTVLGNSAGVGVGGALGAGFTTRATVQDNLISGNGFGVSIVGSSDVVVQGNQIGTDRLGTAALPNNVGIYLSGSDNNLIGGGQPGDGNLLSGNNWDGIRMEANSDSNRVQGNRIGTVAAGDAPLANAQLGINIHDGSSENLIGVETVAAEGNVISGNTQDGISIGGAGSDNNHVAGNLIGTDPTGTAAVGNAGFGILIGTASNVVGTDGDGVADDLEGNVISGNGTGVRLTGAISVGNVIAGNLIGTELDGNTPLGNGKAISVLNGPDSTRIGTDGDGISDEHEGNVIAGNSQGVELNSVAQTTIAGNLIGIGLAGAQLGNGSGSFGAGIFIRSGSANTRVGTDGNGMADAEEANVIAHNAFGILVADAGSTGNRISGNSIYANAGANIDVGVDGVTLNDAGDADSGPNELQNYPTISFVSEDPNTRVLGSLNSQPNTAFTIEFFSTESPGPEFREAKTFLDRTSVTTDANGNASFDVTLPTQVDSTRFVTATATDSAGNTSEISAGKRPEALFTTITMPFDGTLSVGIYDSNGQFVRTLLEASPQLAGSVPLSWDGRDDFGRILPGGQYQWRAVYSQAQAVDDGQVGDMSDQPYGLTEHSNTVSAVAVDAGGNVYEISPFEEAHFELRKWDANGNVVWGFEFAGGEKAIAVDDTYVYGVRVANGENRVERFLSADGSPAPWSSPASGHIVVNTSTDPGYTGGAFGLGVDATRLWVSNDEQDRVEIYDVSTGALLGQFAVTDPKGIVADGQGNAWVAHSGSNVTLFDEAGVVQREIISLDEPFAVALGAPSDTSPNDNLYIGEVGSGQVHEFNLDTATPTLTRSLFGGAEPGPVADDRFYWPITKRAGLAVDSVGRMVVSDDGNKRVLTYNPDGTLLRIRFSEFQPAPFTDPNVDPDMLLSNHLQYQVDYANGDWALTHNWRPADDQLFSGYGVRRTLSNGKDYLFYLDVRGEVDEQLVTVVYALEPTGMRRSAIIGGDANALWNWTDSDGDGQVEESEKTYFNDASSADFLTLAPGVWIDSDGDAWIGHWNESVPGGGNVGNTVTIGLEGFDTHGNPLFNWANRQTVVPADTSQWNFTTKNMRVQPASGEIFLIGSTARNNDLGPFWMGGTAVDRRAADGTRISLLPLSGAEGQPPQLGSSQYMVAIATGTDPDYFYTGHAAFDQHWVRMYTTDGLLVTTGFIGPDNGSSGGWIDHGMGITAFTHPVSGINYIYAEEVLYGKSIRYRIDNLNTLGRTQQDFTWVAEPFHVTNTMDDGDGSLRRAVENANANPGHDTITFDIPGTGVHTISPLTQLPTVTDSITIDGTTEPGYVGTPVVEILGDQLTGGGDGIRITAPDSTVRGLAIGEFSSSGISDSFSGGGTLVEMNYLGVRADGITAAPNAVGYGSGGYLQPGINIRATVRENLISANTFSGVNLVGTSDVVVQGNRIGTDLLGTTALPNTMGIYLSDADDNLLGGGQTGDGNLISGSTWDGIRIEANSSDNRIQGNYIGTNANGDDDLGNAQLGIRITSSAGNLVGVDAIAAEGNLISGNTQGGISIGGAGSDNNHIAGNLIGTDKSGTIAVPNIGPGVQISGASNIVGVKDDGVADTLEGNLISGNAIGIRITGAASDGNVIAGNRIGTLIDGDTPLGNGRGIEVLSGADTTRIGTDGDGISDSEETNVIAGNSRGISLKSVTETIIAGNLVGVGLAGAPLGNGGGGFGAGILIFGDSTDTRVGTDGNGLADADEANIIAHNSYGVLITGASSTSNLIVGNSIHSNAGGGIDLGEDSVTPNDVGDADTGPNELQNFPVLATATAGSSTRVTGSLNSLASTTFLIHFYANTTAHSSGHGEGEIYLGTAPVTTDGAGDVDFDVVLAAHTDIGAAISATATDPAGNTSEFSANVVGVNAPPVAGDDAVDTDEDTSFTFDVLADNGNGADSDPNGNLDPALTINLNSPAAGNLTNNNDGTFTFDPNSEFESLAAGESSPITFDYQIEDTDGLTSSAEVTITVDGVNDAPTLDASGDPTLSTISEDILDASNSGTLVTDLIGSSISDADNGAVEGIAVTSTDNANGDWQYSIDGGSAWTSFGAVSESAAVLLAANGLARVRFLPAADFNGTATIAFRAWDQSTGANGETDVDTALAGGMSAFSTAIEIATISVTAVNDAPSFDALSDPAAVLEDAGAQTVADFASAMTAGPADEAGQNLAFSVVPTGGTLTFVSGPAIDATTGELTYEVSANANGSATFDVTLGDDGGTADGGIDTNAVDTFTISVTAVNDAPAFDALTDPAAVLEDAGAQTVAGFASGMSAGPADEAGQSLAFSVVQTGGTLTFVSGPAIDATTGELTYEVSAGNSGTATFDVTLGDDGGTAGGGVDVSASDSFTITVTPVTANSAPEIVGLQNSSPACGGLAHGDALEIDVDFADVDSADTHTATIFWGDGTEAQLFETDPEIDQLNDSISASHVYTTGGIFAITVTVTDSNGNPSAAAETTATIAGMGVHDRVLYVVGTDHREKITVKRVSGDPLMLKVRVKDKDAGTNATQHFAAADVDSIHLVGCGGGDMLTVATALSTPTTLDGGAGDDLIFGGSGGDTLLGGLGHDKLLGRAGNDTLLGGDGDDKIWGNHGDDHVEGGDGDDKISGGVGLDVLEGGDGHDILWGRRDEDTIYGGDGNDWLFGGLGDDVLYGDDGNDWLHGGAGNDTIVGGDGDDVIFGGAGDDMLFGEDGDDVLFGGSGDDAIDGGDGDDLLFGGPGADTLTGGDGLDLLFEGWTWIWD